MTIDLFWKRSHLASDYFVVSKNEKSFLVKKILQTRERLSGICPPVNHVAPNNNGGSQNID